MIAVCPLCHLIVEADGRTRLDLSEDRERELLISAIQLHIDPRTGACGSNDLDALTNRYLTFMNHIGVYQRWRLFELMEIADRQLLERRDRWRAQLAAQFDGPAAAKIGAPQIDFGADRFATVAAEAASTEFLRSSLEQFEKVTGRPIPEAQRHDFEGACKAYRANYYNAMIDAYRTGAREALKMAVGDFSPEPWTFSDTPQAVDQSWTPPTEFVNR